MSKQRAHQLFKQHAEERDWLPARIKAARHLAGHRSTVSLAREAGVHPSRISHVEAGGKPSENLLRLLADALGIPVEVFTEPRMRMTVDVDGTTTDIKADKEV